MNRYSISEPLGQLLLTVRPETRLPNLVGLPILCGVLLIILGTITTFILSYMPAFWPAPVILTLVLLIYLAISVRDYLKERSLSALGEVYRFDRLHNAVTHNGVLLTALDQIESVRAREVNSGRTSSYTLALFLRDNSEVRIPGVNKSELASLAPVIGNYLGLRVIYDNFG